MAKLTKIATGLLLLYLMLNVNSVWAHQDRVLKLQPDGSIEGLPEKYQPASLKIARDPSNLTTGAVLTLGQGRYEFPDCLLGMFDLPDGLSIALHGSWYHERSTLPPYLVLDLPHEMKPKGWFNGFSYLFSLETAELLELDEFKVTMSSEPNYAGSRMSHVPAYSRYCGGEEPRFIFK